MQHYNLFCTKIWLHQIDNIDNENLKKEILNFSKKKESTTISNIGGYQGHKFWNEKWCKIICEMIPFRKDRPIKDFDIDFWVNINGKGHYNKIHSHIDIKMDPEKHNVLLCGVYYVSVPKNSGDIRFYDPRGSRSSKMMYHRYYLDGFTYHKIQPKEGMVIFFPPWLEHDVGVNMSDENRISMAFNIHVKDPYLNISDQTTNKIKKTFMSYI
jgi:hypothetical protein